MKVVSKGITPNSIHPEIRDGENEPIRLILTKQDRENIAQMNEDCKSILFFPDNMRLDAAKAILGEEVNYPVTSAADAGKEA